MEESYSLMYKNTLFAILLAIENYFTGFKRYALYEREINPRTTKDIIKVARKLFLFAGVEELKYINTAIIREFLYTKKEERLWSARTFRNNRQYLKTFFTYCTIHNLIKENPVSPIEKPRVAKVLPRFLTKDQVRTILYHTEFFPWRYRIERSRNIAIVQTFLYTGMRFNELINLKTEDVNLKNQEILIKHGKVKKERIVPMYPKLIPILEVYLQQKENLKLTSSYFFQSFVDNKKMSAKSIQGFCRKVSVEGGIKFTPHQLRHTFARNTLNAGIGLYMVKEMLGHSSVSTTEMYLSVSKQALKQTFCEAILP